MRNIWKWVLIFLGVFLAVFLIALPILGLFAFRGFPMMGGFYYGMPHMFGGYGFYGGWLMMFGMFLGPLVVIALIVAGVVALVRTTGGSHPSSAQPPAPTRTCRNCGRALQADWSHCPYCGEKV